MGAAATAQYKNRRKRRKRTTLANNGTRQKIRKQKLKVKLKRMTTRMAAIEEAPIPVLPNINENTVSTIQLSLNQRRDSAATVRELLNSRRNSSATVRDFNNRRNSTAH